MEFKQNKEQTFSSDFWYDLTEGYIKPEDLLIKEEDAKKIRDAVSLISNFLDEAQGLGLIEIM